jgi:hypothetical protein
MLLEAFEMSKSSDSVSQSRRKFIKYGVAGAVGFGVASAIEIPILNNAIQDDNNQISQLKTDNDQLQSQNTTLQSQLNEAQSQLNQAQGFLTLNPDERTLVEAIAEAIIPADSNGPGAKEAGIVYAVDRFLATQYGHAANYYMQGPFVLPQTGSLAVQGVDYATGEKKEYIYSGGTITPRLQAGTAYQYAFTPREFWRRGLMYLQDYCNSSYGNKFENLSSSQQIQVLQDLYDDKPTNFEGPTPGELFNELHDMITAGYWTDPLYGGNIGMVGWKLLASNGVNQGTAQGFTPLELAVADHPTKLPPLSLGDIQKRATM